MFIFVYDRYYWMKLNLKILFFLACVSSFFKLNAQQIELVFEDSIHGEFDFFSIDNMDNIYLTNQDVIVKLNQKKDTTFSASLKSIFPHYIEASKNFRVLIFDKDRSVVKFLDNTLSDLTGELNLFDLDLVQPILVCESFNGNSFWIFDAGTLKLLKVNEKFEIITQINNLTFLNEAGKLPTQMIEHNDQLYILLPDEKVLIFDAFGTLIKSVPYKGDNLSVKQNTIIHYVYPYFDFLTLPFLDSNKISWQGTKAIESYQVNHNKLYVQTKSSLQIYRILQKTKANNK